MWRGSAQSSKDLQYPLYNNILKTAGSRSVGLRLEYILFLVIHASVGDFKIVLTVIPWYTRINKCNAINIRHMFVKNILNM